ncbi:hypothetical protein Tco_1083725 [Tanacetum coccineum]
MKSLITPNPKCQLPGQSREGGMGASTPEVRHQSPVSLEDSNKIDLLHLGSGHERREVCSIGYSESEDSEGGHWKNHEGTSSRRTSGYSESEDIEGGH